MNIDIPIGELLSCLWACSTEHGAFICFEEELEALRSEVRKLQRLSTKVERRVQTEERENELQDEAEYWLSNVKDMEEDLNQLLTRASQELGNTCLGSCCPKNCWSRYKIGKKIAASLRKVEDLVKKGEEQIKISVESPSDRLRSSITKEEVGCIGIYGKGGVGKTTIMNDFCNDLLNSERDFNFVIWVVVSQDLNLEKIQLDVGKQLGFLVNNWGGKSPEERAKQILDFLSCKRFILLLDDLWEPVDLTQAGVPAPSNDSKLLFTTRSEDVCEQMGANEKIEILRLRERRAWELFKENVSAETLAIHPDIPNLAETIAKMCNGLPLAVMTVARAMDSKKTLPEWRYSIESLKKTVSEISGTEDPLVYALIKFSYDSLPDETVKCCFLYCTLFPEDFSINKFNLIDYWIGEGFLDEYDDMRAKGQEIISTHLHAYLLEEEGNDVKMHDLIREVALWIAEECGKLKDKYLVKAGAKLTEAPEIGKWERVRRMSLMSNNIQNMTNSPTCDNLLTLFLGNNHLKMISNSFFWFMPSLKVIDLSENRELKELPSGISKANTLQYLNISRTRIRQLPVELKNLVKLKCLNLEYTHELYTIPIQVLSGFSNLRVLRMLHCATSDRFLGDGISTGGFSRELQHLEDIQVITITIRSEYSLQEFISYSKFQACTQALSLNFRRSARSLDISFLEEMNCLDDLEFIECKNLKELIVHESLITRGGCFKSLRKVSVSDCPELKDLTWVSLIPNLEFLHVKRCSNMQEIIFQEKLGERNADTLAKLQVLRLLSLPKLKSIYVVALPLLSLKEITVDDCPNLKKLPLQSNCRRKHHLVIEGWENWWKNLEWEDEHARNTYLSSFKAYMY